MTSAYTLREYPLLTDEATVNVAYVVVEIIFVVIVIGSPFPPQVALNKIHPRNVTVDESY